jgi:hypothetical protein
MFAKYRFQSFVYKTGLVEAELQQLSAELKNQNATTEPAGLQQLQKEPNCNK